jgi:hypothetical protein
MIINASKKFWNTLPTAHVKEIKDQLRGHFQTIMKVIMTLGGGGQGQNANLTWTLNHPLALSWIVYLPLFLSSGKTLTWR